MKVAHKLYPQYIWESFQAILDVSCCHLGHVDPQSMRWILRIVLAQGALSTKQQKQLCAAWYTWTIK